MLTHLSFAERESLEESVDVLEGQTEMLEGQREQLEGRNEVLIIANAELASENETIAAERDVFKALSADVDLLRKELADSNRSLGLERTERVKLESEVAILADRVSLLAEREESLHGIIDLLEDEVASAEKRLEALAESNGPTLPDFGGLSASAIASSNDPLIRKENDQLRNELGKHDEQVSELLGEIGILNQELEVMRNERSKLNTQVRELTTEAERHRRTIDSGVGSAELAGLGGEE